jgi:GntR family transcriptional repressor for pyruvate dehydrogenase complex
MATLSIGKIERKKSYRLIVDQLKHLINTGELRIGEKLPPERVLAQEFGVARPTVREALSALEVLGIIDVQVGSGAYVLQVPQEETPQTVMQLEEESSPLDLFEVRLAIEPLSAAKAAKNATIEDLAQIRTIVSEMEQDVQQNIFSLEKDQQFHLSLAQASKNVHVLEIMKYIISAMQKAVWQKYIMKNIAIEGHKELYVKNHRMIFETIEARDPEQASALMLEHLQGGIVLDDWDQ